MADFVFARSEETHLPVCLALKGRGGVAASRTPPSLLFEIHLRVDNLYGPEVNTYHQRWTKIKQQDVTSITMCMSPGKAI